MPNYTALTKDTAQFAWPWNDAHPSQDYTCTVSSDGARIDGPNGATILIGAIDPLNDGTPFYAFNGNDGRETFRVAAATLRDARHYLARLCESITYHAETEHEARN